MKALDKVGEAVDDWSGGTRSASFWHDFKHQLVPAAVLGTGRGW